MRRTSRLILSLSTALAMLANGSSALASASSNFSQTINPGTLATDIRDASRVTVASPAVSMSAVTVSFDCQAGVTASTGTFGTNTQRIYVDNPAAANNGWTLTVAASSGPTAYWDDGATHKFDFNDGGGSPVGCADDAITTVDTDTIAGQMTINASVGTLTADCTTCTTSNITKGSSAAFDEGTTDSITLLNAASSASHIGRWYLTGASVKQSIPAEQYDGTYTLNLTLTATAS